MIKAEFLIDATNDYIMCGYAVEIGRGGQNSPAPVLPSYTYPIPMANLIFTVGAFTEVLALPISSASFPSVAVTNRLLQYHKPPWT